jgi:hypothetical protein
MTTYVLRSLKVIAKRLTVLLVSVAMFLGLTQPAALADSTRAAIRTETGAANVPGITAPVSGQNIEEMKEQRREWQSRASAMHGMKDDESNSLGETLNEKLNLDELSEGYDPARETEKAYQRDPLGSR